MCMKIFTLSLLLLVTLTWSGVESKTWSGPPVERPLLVGAFNIQNLGNSKMSNKTIMDVVHKVLLRYDLVLVQEIVTLDEDMVYDLMKDLNKLHKQRGSKYMLAISERLGRGTAKEQYAFIYRSDKFQFLDGHSYPDKKDDFMRPPYIGHFATPTLRDLQYMVVIGIHTQPKNAANETSALAKVYDYAAKTFKVKDAMIMGDMNAGCANVRISDWNVIETWNRKDFTWLITHDFDTTQSINCCPYDRIIIAGENMEEAVIANSVGAFKFRDEYGLSSELGLAVSDHWPIEVKLRGGTSQQAKVNLNTNLCLTIEDARQRSIPASFKSQKTVLGFTIELTEITYEIYATLEDSEELCQKFQKLQGKYPELISSEVLETVLYKVKNGSLQDPTSNDDLEENTFFLTISFDIIEQRTTVHFCAATTLN